MPSDLVDALLVGALIGALVTLAAEVLLIAALLWLARWGLRVAGPILSTWLENAMP